MLSFITRLLQPLNFPFFLAVRGSLLDNCPDLKDNHQGRGKGTRI